MLEHIEVVYQPTTISKALGHLRRARDRGCVIAGGTDLLVRLDQRVRLLVDITRLNLSYIRKERRRYRFGAGASIAALARSELTRDLAGGLVAHAAASWGSVQISNVASLGGNLVQGSPAADMATALLALDAVAVVHALGGKYLIPLVDLWCRREKSLIRQGLLLEVLVRRSAPLNRLVGSFQKLAPIGDSVAIASVAIALEIDQHGRCTAARIAAGALAPTPIRVGSAEKLLVGRHLELPCFEDVCGAVARSTSPVSDFRASAEYRREMSRILTRRALEEILQQIEKTS